MAGQVWDEQAIVVSEMVRKRGNTIITLSEEEAVRWRKATDPVIQTWLGSMKEQEPGRREAARFRPRPARQIREGGVSVGRMSDPDMGTNLPMRVGFSHRSPLRSP